jgi:hypothetical protein
MLVHIGPHKTGTTAVQHALYDAKRRLAKSGVSLPINSRHPRGAFLAATGAGGLRGEGPADPGQWIDIVARIRTLAGRGVLSSEILTSTKADRLPGLLDDLGGDRVQVVVTLRSLTAILPSQWQEHLNNRLTTSYPSWLSEVFDQPESGTARRFWRRHSHAALIERWASIVGPGRMTVIIVDEANPRFTLDAFETLLALSPGTLQLGSRANRSLSLGEAELLRLINIQADQLEWSDTAYAQLVRRKLFERLKQRMPTPEDQPIRTPEWALARATAMDRSTVSAIRESGLRVLGDPDRLVATPTVPAPSDPDRALSALVDLVAGMALRDSPAGAAEVATTGALLRVAAARSARSARASVRVSGSRRLDTA